MTTLHSIFKTYTEEAWLEDLNLSSKDRRAKLAEAIFRWVKNSARKKARISASNNFVYVFDADNTKDLDKTDLPAKLDLFRDQILKMVEDVRFFISDGKVSAESNSSPRVLYSLQYGSDWFDPHGDIVGFMIKTL